MSTQNNTPTDKIPDEWMAFLNDLEQRITYPPNLPTFKKGVVERGIELYRRSFQQPGLRWIRASERLPLHKAHWNTNRFGVHDNDFPVRMNGRYSMGNIYDERRINDLGPKYMLKFEGKEHYENEFSEIEWLEEAPIKQQDVSDINVGDIVSRVPDGKEGEEVIATARIVRYYHDLHCSANPFEPMGNEGCSCTMYKRARKAENELVAAKIEANDYLEVLNIVSDSISEDSSLIALIKKTLAKHINKDNG